MKKDNAASRLRHLKWIEDRLPTLGYVFRPPEQGGTLENRDRWAAAAALEIIGITLNDDGTCKWKDFEENGRYVAPWND
jgi:hypothetical protein